MQSTGSSKLRANICRGASLPRCTPYLTLSHCWGGEEFLTTTHANLCAYECSLPIDSLSRTFQDAFLATMKLNFQYIWIDSLCIVQDDPDDWKRESLSMHKIYKHAACNISASGFANGKEGFILSNRRINPSPVAITLGRAANQSSSEKSHYLACAFPWEVMREGPVFNRAWTLQEQLLVSSLTNHGRKFLNVVDRQDERCTLMIAKCTGNANRWSQMRFGLVVGGILTSKVAFENDPLLAGTSTLITCQKIK